MANENATVDTGAQSPNHTVKLHRGDHPQNRSSYTIDGQPGNVVFFNTLFKNGVPPATITFDVEMVAPKADAKEAKAAAAAQKAIEKAAKAEAKIKAAAAKAEAKAAKAAKILADAKAKIEAANAAAAASTESTQ